MEVRITGDFKELRALTLALGPANQARYRKTISRRFGEANLNLVSRTFDTQTSPYGEPWQKTKEANDNDILVETGALKNSIRVARSENEITVYTNSKYADVHQFGRAFRKTKRHFITKKGVQSKRRRTFQTTTSMPRRSFFPLGQALPPRWVQVLDDLSVQVFMRMFRNKRSL